MASERFFAVDDSPHITGIIGVVDKVMEDDRIEVTIGENTKVQIIKSTITSLLKKEEVKK